MEGEREKWEERNEQSVERQGFTRSDDIVLIEMTFSKKIKNGFFISLSHER